MKFLILFLAIQFATIQAGDNAPRCEITDAALEELGQLRQIVEQLKALVETLTSRPVEPPKPDETECQRQAREADERGLLLGAYRPTCTDEGKFTPQQCHPSTGHCWCVDEDMGTEVPDTRSGPTEDRIECVVTIEITVDETECQRQAREADEEGLIGAYIPTCTDDGRFTLQQCHGSTGHCWCVDEEIGTEVPDTRTGPTEDRIECGVSPVDECEHVICTADWTPVCGSDGQTYSNLCAFQNAQCIDQSLTYTEGECAAGCPEACPLEYDPMCGTDRKTYGNRCELEAARCNSDDGTPTLAYEGTCRVEEDEIVDPILTYTWKEATLSWTPPTDEVYGYFAKVTIDGRSLGGVRLSPVDTSYTTEVSPKQNYTIEIQPIMGTGPGTTYSTGIFIPACPVVCTSEYAPVCGTDGNTYSNMCAFEIAQCETGDETLVIDHDGACDPCAEIQCDVPICTDGFVIAQQPPPGECCVGCVNECELIVCDPPICPPGFELGTIEGECCPGCIDPCAEIQCDVPICADGFVVAQQPLPGECCVGCVDKCELIVCDQPQCEDGYEEGQLEGECCPGCIRQVFEDCSDAQASGMTNNGAYLIQPIGVDAPVEVWCDFEEAGGRWTVILRRQPSDTSFLRDYDGYVDGFGSASEAYWIGLENLYRLNKNGNTKMFVKGTDHLGETASGQYNVFRIGAADTDYTLETIVSFRGTTDANIGNALAYNKGAAFSAPDRDNDNGDRDCATVLAGGWWHKVDICTRANPLGEFVTPDEFAFEKGVFWAPFRGKGKSLQFLELKVRPA